MDLDFCIFLNINIKQKIYKKFMVRYKRGIENLVLCRHSSFLALDKVIPFCVYKWVVEKFQYFLVGEDAGASLTWLISWVIWRRLSITGTTA